MLYKGKRPKGLCWEFRDFRDCVCYRWSAAEQDNESVSAGSCRPLNALHSLLGRPHTMHRLVHISRP